MITRRVVIPLLVLTVVTTVDLPRTPAIAAPTATGPDIQPAATPSADAILRLAMQATHELVYDARMMIVSTDPDGPGITELDVQHTGAGQLQIARAESWLVDVSSTAASFDSGDGEPVLLGDVRTLPFSLGEVRRTYDVSVEGRADLDGEPAVALSFVRDGVMRERLYVSDRSHLVVRRETFGLSGRIDHVVVLTDVDVAGAGAVDALAGEAGESLPRSTAVNGPSVFGVRQPAAPTALASAGSVDWVVPMHLGSDFDLRASYALDDVNAVQMVYSDGLYTISLLEQDGQLDHGGLRGGVPFDIDGRHGYRWPGSRPERMVFTAGGRTFTVVSDAPTDVVVAAIGDLPADAAPSSMGRIGRGLARMASWVWPFS